MKIIKIFIFLYLFNKKNLNFHPDSKIIYSSDVTIM